MNGIREYRLANGLRVILKEDHAFPVAALAVTYLAGSRHETAGYRGATHLLEHMMFKDTRKYQNKKGNAIFSVLQETGARMNGATFQDRVEFYEVFPIAQIDTALDIEAERMRHALLAADDLRAEMPVVQSEFDQLENSPEAALEMEVWKAAFTAHPYHHPVIGLRSDIAGMTAKNLKKFYDSFIQPRTAVLILMGDFKVSDILPVIEKKFGALSSPGITLPEIPAEPEQKELRRVEVRRDDLTQMITAAFKAPPLQHPDAAVMEVISQIMGGGPLSRLYRALIESGKAAAVQTDYSKTADPGLLMSQVILNSGVSHEDAEKILNAKFSELSQTPVPPAELLRAKNVLLAGSRFSQDGLLNQALRISWAAGSADWSLALTFPEQIAAVTAADIQRVAAAYLKPEKETIGYLISKQTAAPAMLLPEFPAGQTEVSDAGLQLLSFETKEETVSPFSGRFSDRLKVTEMKGIKVVTIPTGVQGVVTLRAVMEGGGAVRPEEKLAAELTANLLNKGTDSKNQWQIADFFENRGAEWSAEISGKFLKVGLRCLSPDLPDMVAMTAAILRRPAFPERQFGIEKELKRAEILTQMGDTLAQGYAALSRRVYPAGHPNYIPPFEEQLRKLEKITLADVKDFYEKRYGGAHFTVIAAGDVPHEVLAEAVKKYFSGWRENELPKIIPADLKLPPAGSHEIPVGDKVKIDVLIGHALPLLRGDKDYLPAYVGNHILGGDFTGRLLKKVRVEKGLTYSIISLMNGITQEIQGQWFVNVILNRRTLQAGMAATTEIIRKWAKQGVTQKELDKKIISLKGRFYLDVSTTEGMADQLAAFEALGLGETYLDEYPAELERLTLNQVNQAIRRCFHPDQSQTIIAGSL